jgi:hypothetical protein
MLALVPGLGLFGTVLTAGKRKPRTRKTIVGMSVLGLLLLVSLFALGCGGGGSNKQTTPASQQVTVMVTGTSGALRQSAAVAVTVR